MAFRAAGVRKKVASGDLAAIALPASMAAGEIMLLWVHSGDNIAHGTPAGWTLKETLTNTATQRRSLFWRAWVTGDAAPTVTHALGSSAVAWIEAWTGRDTANPFSAFGSQSNASSATITAPTITPGSANDDVGFNGVVENVDTSTALTQSGYSGTNPTLTERVDDETGLGTTEVGMATASGTTDGAATGSRTSTANAAGVNIGTLFALKPASVPGAILFRDAAGPFRRGPFARQFHMLQSRPLSTGTVVTGADVTVALTGVESVASVGTLGVDIQVPVTGVSSTAAVGTVAPSTTVPITGVSSTASVGSLTPSTSVSLTGVASTASVGTLAPSTTVPITGVASTLSVGTLAPTTVLILSGVQSAASVGTMAPSTTVALLGVSSTGQVGSVVASGGDVVPTSPTPEIIFLLPDGKLAKRIGGRTYQILDD